MPGNWDLPQGNAAVALIKPFQAAVFEPNSEDRIHHSYSPSTLANLECCPCYKGRESKHARTIAGTLAHKVTETLEDDQKLSDDDAEFVAECLDFYEKRKQVMVENRERACAKDGVCYPAIEEMTEQYLKVDDLAFADGVQSTTGGYVDRLLFDHTQSKAELFDWKFGAWEVEDASTNLQGIAYVLGAFREYPSLQEITFHFCQPPVKKITSAVFSRKGIADWYLRVQTVVARARFSREIGTFETASPSVPVCNFCANIGVCPKVAAFACKVGSKFYPLEIPESITPTEVHDPKNTSLGLRLAAVVKIWADAYRAQITDRIFRGKAELPPGYEISSKRNREIVNKPAFKKFALEHLTQEEFDESVDYLFGPVEDKISEKAQRGSKKAAVESFKKQLEDTGTVKRSPEYHFLKAIPQ